jgi:hypothetical protein
LKSAWISLIFATKLTFILEIALHVRATEVLTKVWEISGNLEELDLFSKLMGQES